MKILIVFLGGIGNMVLFEPTLRSIREKYPNAEIHLWLKERVSYELIKNSNLVDKVIPYYKKSVTNIFRQIKVYRGLLTKKYDIVISAFLERGIKVRLFIWGLRGKIKIGYRANNFTDKIYNNLLNFKDCEHELDRHFKIVQLLCEKAEKDIPRIYFKDRENKFVEQFLQKHNIRNDDVIIGVHPGCSEHSKYKRWSVGKFIELIDMLCEKHKAKILIFGGKQEKYLSEEIIDNLNSQSTISLVGKTSILETAAVIKKCNCFISNDSGLMHIASAVGIPQIALFGKSSVEKNCPVSERAIIIDGKKEGITEGNSINNIKVERVMGEVVNILKG